MIYKSQTCTTCPHLVLVFLNVVCILIYLSSFRFYHLLLYRSEFIFTFSNLVVFYSIIEHHERCNLCCEHLRWFMKALKEVHSSINHKLVAHVLILFSMLYAFCHPSDSTIYFCTTLNLFLLSQVWLCMLFSNYMEVVHKRAENSRQNWSRWTSLDPGLYIPDIVLQLRFKLRDKIQNGNPGLEAN